MIEDTLLMLLLGADLSAAIMGSARFWHYHDCSTRTAYANCSRLLVWQALSLANTLGAEPL